MHEQKGEKVTENRASMDHKVYLDHFIYLCAHIYLHDSLLQFV